MKVLTIIGARPQFVKAAVISRSIIDYNNRNDDLIIDENIVHTGQHYDENMSDIFFQELQIPKPHYSLSIGGGTHGAMTGHMIGEIERIIFDEKPNVVLVYGDTNSTLAGALAAVKAHVPIAHVESGLRSFNMKMPEEVNRILTDRVSDILFCPTKKAVENLKREGIENWVSSVSKDSPEIHLVGDVMYDATLFYQSIALPTKNVRYLLQELNTKGFYLATIHRAENTDDKVRLQNIMDALDKIAAKIPVILPIHPRTKKKLSDYGINYENITTIDPVGYFDMITLLSKCKAVFTDSGGVQKEAYFFKKPCVTLRSETEWTELIDEGCNTLADADIERILLAEQSLKDISVSHDSKLYGDGTAGEKILAALIRNLT